MISSHPNLVPFEHVLEFVNRYSSHTTLEDEEAKAYYDLLSWLPAGSVVWEIGCQFGRSSGIAAIIGKESHFKLHFVDPFTEPPEAKDRWLAMMRMIKPDFGLHICRSDDPKLYVSANIDAIFIDGDHTYETVLADCRRFLPRVKVDGFACFHDYGRPSLPDVSRAVLEYLVSCPERWVQRFHVGTLSVWRKD